MSHPPFSGSGPGVRLTLRYDPWGDTWRQSFTAVTPSQAQVEQLLRGAGFSNCSWHGSAGTWASAVAA